MKRLHDMPFGAAVIAPDLVRFRLWAPAAETVELCLEPGDDEMLPPMTAFRGWFGLDHGCTARPTRYLYRIDGGLKVPDPASRYNPLDVHGASEVIAAGDFEWHDTGWKGRPWQEAVIYELHVGTFTGEGTYRGVEGRLDLSRARRDGGRADAARRLSWASRLGLRWRASVRTRRRVWPAPRTSSGSVSRAPARPDGIHRCGLQPFRPGRKLSAPLRAAVLHRPPSHAVGGSHQLRWTRAASSGIFSYTTRYTGSKNFRSMACASTPSTPSTTIELDILTELASAVERGPAASATFIWCWRTT